MVPLFPVIFELLATECAKPRVTGNSGSDVIGTYIVRACAERAPLLVP